MTIKVAQTPDLQLRQYQALLELSKAIASHRNLSDLLQDLAGRLKELFDFHELAVMLHDGSRNVMQMHASQTSEPAMEDFPTEFPVEGSISGWVWQNQQPFITHDVKQETGFTTLHLVRNFPVRSVCILPLTTANQRLGVLCFASDKAAAYDRLDLEFAQLVATQIAVVVEAQTYQERLARERDRSALVLEVNNMLVSNLNLRELMSAISAGLRRVVPHDAAGLALYDPTINQLRVSALEFTSNEDLLIEDEIVPLEENPAGMAFATRQTLILGSGNGAESGNFGAGGMKSGCIIPLVSHDRTLGILSLTSMRENAFTAEDAELLGQIAKQVAIAVENACAFRKIEEFKNKLEEEKLYLEEEIRTEHDFEEIIGNSPALRRVLQEVETVAPADSNVLIYGETGTGKELIARAIHNLSARRGRTLVKVNCAAIPTGLLESEMFGHERGAFTGATERRVGRFETAHQGTIFLDEIEDIPLELQPKLLRVLQEQEFERLGSSRTIRVDVRVVAATNVDLAQLVDEKKFRSDLFYRFNVFPISLPPLRERPEDIPMLVHFFANRFAQRMKKQIERIPTETMNVLIGYSWPGNIRELQNLIERAVILTRGPVLEIPLPELKGPAKAATVQFESETLEAIERKHILRVLRETKWVIGGPHGAAAQLGMNRTTLHTRMRKLG
ncbi:MAG: sigma 54-interacting transcriptional regulator, partial [Acidobacteria bacterium]|nr:sigma 54-interacting transcriptional regulator [Acidobacteriota bacterium]